MRMCHVHVFIIDRLKEQESAISNKALATFSAPSLSVHFVVGVLIVGQFVLQNRHTFNLTPFQPRGPAAHHGQNANLPSRVVNAKSHVFGFGLFLEM